MTPKTPCRDDAAADPPAPYRIVGPHVWTLVRGAYLGGMSARACAERFGVGLSNLKRKAREEGWRRADHARALDRAHEAAATSPQTPDIPAFTPDPPQDAEGHPTARALDKAEQLLLHGDPARAAQTLQAAETLAEARQRLAAAQAETEVSEARMIELRAAFQAELWDRAQRLAEQMLSDRLCGIPAIVSGAVYRWRAMHFGPEVARNDFIEALNSGCASEYWDEEGNLRPPPDPAGIDLMMAAQHQRECAWRREHRGDQAADWEELV
ncbi:hypothetical protein Q0812_13660 [Brevundimonas sp. 2R-24]|uniref:Uncharacterized protein n=1 Tax=Peiella sedimenti TaxID=3061083 RepID=A0ABT8SPX4_9CAUL|nr:hypothetical protein [Caulobacteraceae bacterium XZ-24]